MTTWYAIALLDGAYMLVQSDEKIDRQAPLLWREGSRVFGIPPGEYRVAYGPCSQDEAEQYLVDISGYSQEVIIP